MGSPRLFRCTLLVALARSCDIDSYYADVDLPPVVQRLAQLVAERDYKTVRDEVDDIWNQLLRYHKQKKLRPKPSLTTTFNTIHAIVREM